jgi:hypothetical protein
MCHLSNLLFAAGLFLNPRFWFLWRFRGFVWDPLVVGEVIRTKKVVPMSVLTHFGGAGIALYAAHRGGAPGTWWASWLFALGAQGVCRLFTRPEWNVNVTHRVYDAWKPFFKNFRLVLAFLYWDCGVILYAMDNYFPLFRVALINV